MLRVARFAARFGFRDRRRDARADARASWRPANWRRWRPSACGRSSRAASWKRIRRACSPRCAPAARWRRCCPRSTRCTPCSSRTTTPARSPSVRSTGPRSRRLALPARYAVLTQELDRTADAARKRIRRLDPCRAVARAEAVSARLKVPVDCRDAARLAARWHRDGGARRNVVAGAIARPDRCFRCAAPSGAARDAHRCRRGSRGRAGSAGHPRGRARNASLVDGRPGEPAARRAGGGQRASMQAPSPSRRLGGGAVGWRCRRRVRLEATRSPRARYAIAASSRRCGRWKRRQMR